MDRYEEMIQLLNRNVNYSGELKLSREMTEIFFRWLAEIGKINRDIEAMLREYKSFYERILNEQPK